MPSVQGELRHCVWKATRQRNDGMVFPRHDVGRLRKEQRWVYLHQVLFPIGRERRADLQESIRGSLPSIQSAGVAAARNVQNRFSTEMHVRVGHAPDFAVFCTHVQHTSQDNGSPSRHGKTWLSGSNLLHADDGRVGRKQGYGKGRLLSCLVGQESEVDTELSCCLCENEPARYVLDPRTSRVS